MPPPQTVAPALHQENRSALGHPAAGTVTRMVLLGAASLHRSIAALSLASRLRPPLCKALAGGIPAPLYPSARLRQGVLPVGIARGSFILHRPQVMPSSVSGKQDAAFEGDRSCTVSVCCARERPSLTLLALAGI